MLCFPTRPKEQMRMPLLHPAILLACISESHHYPGPWVVHLNLRVDGLCSPRIDHILGSHLKCVGGKNGDSSIFCVSCRVEPWPGSSGSAFASVDPSQADRCAVVYSTGHERLRDKWGGHFCEMLSLVCEDCIKTGIIISLVQRVFQESCPSSSS